MVYSEQGKKTTSKIVYNFVRKSLLPCSLFFRFSRPNQHHGKIHFQIQYPLKSLLGSIDSNELFLYCDARHYAYGEFLFNFHRIDSID